MTALKFAPATESCQPVTFPEDTMSVTHDATRLPMPQSVVTQLPIKQLHCADVIDIELNMETWSNTNA